VPEIPVDDPDVGVERLRERQRGGDGNRIGLVTMDVGHDGEAPWLSAF